MFVSSFNETGRSFGGHATSTGSFKTRRHRRHVFFRQVTINKNSSLSHIIYCRDLKWMKGCISEVNSLCTGTSKATKGASRKFKKDVRTISQFLVVQQCIIHSIFPVLRIEKCECMMYKRGRFVVPVRVQANKKHMTKIHKRHTISFFLCSNT